MDAFTITQHEGAPALRRFSLPVPQPGPGEITIDVAVAGIGMIDALWASGAMPADSGFVPGLEVSGTVRALGAGVDGPALGRQVAAFLPSAGGFAEVACAPASLVAEKPTELGSELAAVVPVNTVTAHLALTTVARFSAGESVLVHGGLGGLGSQFAEVARTLGANRIEAVVGSPRKRRLAEKIGYDEVHLRDELDSIPDDAFDLVVDPVGGTATETAFRNLRNGGRLIRVGNASQAADVSLSSLAHWLENKTTAGFNLGAWLSAQPSLGAASLECSLPAVADKQVRVDLTETVDPERLDSVLASLLRGETTGRYALRPDSHGISD